MNKIYVTFVKVEGIRIVQANSNLEVIHTYFRSKALRASRIGEMESRVISILVSN